MRPEAHFGAFSAWEKRTRGYQVYPFPTELEPPYYPPIVAVSPPTFDDGRRAGFWRTLLGPAPKQATPLLPSPEVVQPSPTPNLGGRELVELQLVLPEEFLVKTGASQAFLASLTNLSSPVAFELLGLSEGIVVQLCCAAQDERQVSEAISAFFPDVRIRKKKGLLESEWSRLSRFGMLIGFGLFTEFYRPLVLGPSLETDPLVGVIGALNSLEEEDLGVVQILFAPAHAPWDVDLWNFVQAYPEQTREAHPQVKAKLDGGQLHSVVIRIAALSPDPYSSANRARLIGTALLSATRSDHNELFPLDAEGYPDEVHAEDILKRTSHRPGMLLSLSELSTLVHLPTAHVRSSRLIRQSKRTKAAPALARQGSLQLGSNSHEGETTDVSLATHQRLKHCYVIGASGTGKSTLLLNLIRQDLEAGQGLMVLDPHGDLIDDALSVVPPGRASDVLLLDPADAGYPVGFNVLQAHSELEKTLLSSDLVSVFRRLSTSWGDQMTAVLGNSILAILESRSGGTLLDLRRFLVDESFRTKFLAEVEDQEVVYFWTHEFPLLKGLPQAPLLTRLDAFLRPKAIRYMAAQRLDHLDFRAIMDRRKIVFARLSHGAIGEDNAHLLGSLLIARFAQAAASRQEQEKEARIPFFVYIDEFHNFITPGLAQLLSGVRKYGVGLTLAHQDLRQLKSRSEDVASAVLSSCYTRVVFRVGDSDSKTLEDGFSFFEAKDLQNLGTGKAIARIERAEFDFNLEIPLPVRFSSDEALGRQELVRDRSRAQYAATREEIEEVLKQSYPAAHPEAGKEKPKPPDPTTPKSPKEIQKATKPETPVTSAQETTRTAPIRTPPPPVEPGRGGPQHKYLQSLIRRSAEDRGFRATIEKPVLDGAGHVDVALEKGDFSIACEICITTPLDHELANVSKCLAAGFDHVVLVSSENKVLRQAQAAIEEEVGQTQLERLHFVTPHAFFELLDQFTAQSQDHEATVSGYRVKVRFKASSEEDQKQRQQMLAEVISKSLRRIDK